MLFESAARSPARSPATIDPSTALLKVVSFQAGGFRFAVEAAQVKFMLAELPAEDSKPVACEAEALIGLPDGDTSSRRWLAVETRGVDIYIAVSEPVLLQALPATQVFPLPDMFMSRTALTGVRAFALDGQVPVLLVDIRAAIEHRLSRTAG